MKGYFTKIYDSAACRLKDDGVTKAVFALRQSLLPVIRYIDDDVDVIILKMQTSNRVVEGHQIQLYHVCVHL
jgi:hypothetical protein